MKKTRTPERKREADEEMLPEYRFDYGKARPNRFAARVKRNRASGSKRPPPTKSPSARSKTRPKPKR